MKELIQYIEDQILQSIQRRCGHPGRMVAADILEGCSDGIEVKYCRRCGAVMIVWNPSPDPATWRSPDPNLWRDNAGR